MDMITKEDNVFNSLDYVSKSNYLISAKYSSSLLECQMLLLSLQRVKENAKGQLTSEISAAEVKYLLGKDYGEFYLQLKKTALRLMKNVIMIEDAENKHFKASNIISDAESINGNFIVTFNPLMKFMVTDLKKNFTSLSIKVMTSYESVVSFRLYEVLKSKCFYPKGLEKKDNIFQIEYDLAELKVTLGAIDMSEPRIAAIINNKANPDYDKALKEIKKMAEKDKSIKKPKYETWYDFKRQVLDRAIPEINEKSDIHIDYDIVKKGQGGKVSKIMFTVQLIKNSEVDVSQLSEEDKLEYIEKASDVLDNQIGLKDVKKILEAAEYDIDRIIHAYEISKSQTEIHNLAGWLIKAIENGYEEPVTVKNKKQYEQYMQNDYDFEEIEKDVIAN